MYFYFDSCLKFHLVLFFVIGNSSRHFLDPLSFQNIEILKKENSNYIPIWAADPWNSLWHCDEPLAQPVEEHQLDLGYEGEKALV